MEWNRQDAPQGWAADRWWGEGDDVAASRRAALETLGSTLLESPDAGPVLLTGEAGSGKSWLRKLVVGMLPAGWKAAVVEVGPAHDAIDFLTLAAERMGVSAAAIERAAALRIAASRALEDDANDGRRRVLVVEDAHHASPAVWAEVEALCDGLGTPAGFAAVLLVGRTDLARRLSTRALRPVADRLSRHVHLPPLDVDEAASLLPEFGADEVERLHRDAAGNPRRLLALAGERPARPIPASPRPQVSAESLRTAPSAPLIEAPRTPVVRADRDDRFEIAPPIRVDGPSRAVPPPLLPSRPPLRVEEGLIEVGWAGGLDVEEGPDAEAREASTGEGELIEDHYAALQAWDEWARNRDRLDRGPDAESEPESEPEAGSDAVVDDAPARDGLAAEAEVGRDEGVQEPEPETGHEAEEEAVESPLGPGVRAEGSHDHAPYSPLFTRLRQSI